MKTKSAEEILDKHNTEGLLTTQEVLEAMEEYASQFKVEMPSDEEIEDEFPYARSYGNYCRQEGAKWLKSKIESK